MKFITGSGAGEFINYPAGSEFLYAFPPPMTELPAGEYSVLHLVDGGAAILEGSLQTLVTKRLSSARPVGDLPPGSWMDIEQIYLALERGEALYLRVGAGVERQVEANAVTGQSAEDVATTYTLTYYLWIRIARLEPFGIGVPLPVEIETRPPLPTEGECYCLLAQHPCGDRLAINITPPSPA